MVETFAALAEPTRLRIVELLRSGPRPVNDIGERLELTQPQVSKHLRTLKEAGLVDVQPLAQQRFYRQFWDARFDALDALVTELRLKEKKNARKRHKSRK
jgi:DNA-binding transcriptional ArsR family regulator